MLKIVVMAALPQEYAHFRKISGRWLTLETRPFRKFSLILPDKEIMLIETGMGGQFAAGALMSVLASGPDLLIFAGFAGGLHPGLAVGTVCVAKRTMLFDPSGGGPEGKTFASHFPGELETYFAARDIRPVTAVTVSSPPDKKRLSALTAGDLAVVDMETAELAGLALCQRLPFLCFRAVSDSLDDELGFDLAQITGKGGKVDPLKTLGTIIQNPAVIRAFYRSWLRSRRAGKNLGAVLIDFINTPAAALQEMMGKISIECG